MHDLSRALVCGLGLTLPLAPFVAACSSFTTTSAHDADGAVPVRDAAAADVIVTDATTDAGLDDTVDAASIAAAIDATRVSNCQSWKATPAKFSASSAGTLPEGCALCPSAGHAGGSATLDLPLARGSYTISLEAAQEAASPEAQVSVGFQVGESSPSTQTTRMSNTAQPFSHTYPSPGGGSGFVATISTDGSGCVDVASIKIGYTPPSR